MSHKGLKSRHPGLLPDEEKRKCGAAKYCAEFLSIGNHSLKHMRTRSGLSDLRHSQSQWKLEQNIIAWVVIVGMVANALLRDRGRSCTVLPEAGSHPTWFWINRLSGRITGSRVITGRERQSNAVQEVGWTHSSDDGQADDTPNLYRRVQGATVIRIKPDLAKGS
jgi:hypothetical protein